MPVSPTDWHFFCASGRDAPLQARRIPSPYADPDQSAHTAG